MRHSVSISKFRCLIMEQGKKKEEKKKKYIQQKRDDHPWISGPKSMTQ